MAILLTVDETSGVQNSEGGVTSNDTDASLPIRFASVLSLEAAGGGTPTATALSGVDGTVGNSGGVNIVNFSSPVTDVAFTDSAGDPLAGVDSGLLTTGGHAILLYTSSVDNNVLLAKDAVTGEVVFAAFLDTGIDTVGSDVGATGAKLWLVQFGSLYHPDTDDPNDVVLMTQALWVAVDSVTNFSLSNAPAGQNRFLMFGDGTPSSDEVAIIVTGEAPSTSGSVGSGSTVNSGQGGGGSVTTLGTNNQMIDPGEAMYFTFVTGANTDYTVPNLDQNEADVLANIQFADYHEISSATFSLVQLQPPKGATLLIAAILNADTTEKGSTFVPGLPYTPAEEVNVISVSVVRGGTTILLSEGGTTSAGGIAADFTGNTVVLAGLEQGDRITYTTDGNHNRLLIDNVGNSDPDLAASFDVGAFALTGGSVTAMSMEQIAFADDAPTATVERTLDTVTMDESVGVDAGDANADADDDVAANPFPGGYGTPLGLLAGIDLVDTTTSAGADADGAPPPTLTLAITGGSGASSGLSRVDGAAIDLWLEPDGTVTGRVGGAAGAVVFAIRIDDSGAVTVAQYAAVAHPLGGANHDDSVDLTGRLSAVVTQQDGEGDTASASVDIGDAIRFQDDGPSVSTVPGVQLDDETLSGGTAGGPGDVDPDTAHTSGSLLPVFGQDGAGTVAWLTDGAPDGFSYELDGDDLVIKQGSTPVLTLTLDTATGAYTVTQEAPLLHAPGDGENNQSFTVAYRVTDADGDTVDGSLTLDVDDDTPTVVLARTSASLVLDESLGADPGDANADADGDVSGNPFPGSYGTPIGLLLDRSLVDLTASAGADGGGALDVALAIVGGSGTDSGLATTAGQAIALWQDAEDTVTGRIGGAGGTVAFAVRINAAGQVSVAQYLTLDHPLGGSAHDDSLDLTGLLEAVVTQTDADEDAATESIGIGDAIRFEDDGPAVLARSDLIYAGQSNPVPGGTGVFQYTTGADARTGPWSASESDFASVVLVGGLLGTHALSNPSVTWVSEDADSAVFAVAFDYLTDGGAGTTATGGGTLTFDKVAGTYHLSLGEPFPLVPVVQTAGSHGFTGYEQDSVQTDKTQPMVNVATVTSGFYVQFTGYAEPRNGTGQDNLVATGAPAGSANAFANGDLFLQQRAWVSVSNVAIGVAGDTIQKGEVLDMDFFRANPHGFSNAAPDLAVEGLYLKFDGISHRVPSAEDFVIILKLVDPATGGRTTKALVVENLDIFVNNDPAFPVPAAYAGIGLDNNDGLVIIERNDYNVGGENWLIEGAQVLTSTEGITGSGINLNPFTGTAGASTGTQNFSSVTSDNDVMKITSVGFLSAVLPDATLRFDVVVQDADGDLSATQRLDVTVVGNDFFIAGPDREAIQGRAGVADTFVFGSPDTSPVGDLHDVITGFTSGQDRLHLAGIDAVPGGTDNAFTWLGTGAFSSVAGQLRFDVATSSLQGDLTGDGVADFVVELAGVGALDVADLVL